MKTEAEALEQKVEGYVHPPASKAAEHEAKALDTLAALLDSEDERIRLEAAQAILNRRVAASSTSKAAGVVTKIAKVI